MSYGPVLNFAVSTMASDTTLSSECDLGKAWNKVMVVIPSMASGTNVFVQACGATGGTFRRVFHGPTTTSAAVGAWQVDSSMTNCIVPVNNCHARYVKVELGTAMTATTANFAFICSD